jgi:glucose/arabinose dehydrogenase
MLRGVVLIGVAALACACAASGAEPQSEPQAPQSASYQLRPVWSVPAPVHVASTSSERNRVYIVEQVGRIRVAVSGRLRAAPFLDIRPLVQSGGEQGLLSVAFHPRYASNRRLYVNYTNRNGDTRVVEYHSDRAGTRAITRTARQLLAVDQPYPNHNGGQLAFGPDGRLYVGMGDGGAGGDPHNHGQTLSSRLGKLLSIDPLRRGARWRIDGYGLRNPWRFAFDRATGDLWMADVGQGAWEEVNFTPRRSPGLENYGWRVYEGRARFSSEQPNAAGRLVFPVHVYANGGSECSVTGGFLYRGRAIPQLRGRYVYGDYCSGRIWSLRLHGGRVADNRVEPFRVAGLSSFGEDAAGELYATSLEGRVFKLVP